MKKFKYFQEVNVMKKMLSIILTIAMLLSTVTALADYESDITVLVDGEKVEFDVQPIIENDRVLVPVRAIFEKLDASIYWYADTQTVFARKNISDGESLNLALTIGENVLTKQIYSREVVPELKSSDKFELDVPAKIVDDRTLVPLRAVSEAFDCTVEWDEATQTVTITTNSELIPEDTEEAQSYETFEQKLLSNMPDDKNYMISPFSLKMALLMAANGASGETQSEILNMLDITDLDTFNEYVKSFMEYAATEENNDDLEDAKTLPVFEVANSIWLNKDFGDGEFENTEFSDEFSKIISDFYGGTSEAVNNENKVEKVNSWVAEKTHDKISNIIDEQTDFLAAIVNAIYMKAEWNSQFDEEATYKDNFTDRNGNENQIDFMHKTAYFNYYLDDDISLIQIPYYGGLSMYVALGDAEKFQSVKDNTQNTCIALSLPKFKIESNFELKTTLQDMGVNLAFNKETAVFDKMLTPVPEQFWIDDVIQKTYIDVDENGTEAAAATYIGMAATSAVPREPIEFKADKPFTYFICDDETGQIFFMGEYAFTE
jgi:serpin B